MRKWYKYWIDPHLQGIQHLSIDADFFAHSKAMGGYKPDPACINAESFFSRYLPRNGSRHDCYNEFLQCCLKKKQRVLSLGSGRAANEAFLFHQGYNVTCSDIEVPPVFRATQAFFQGLSYRCLDILKTPAEARYDAVVVLSLIYLFTDVQLKKALENIQQSIEGDGYLVLDSAGSPSNFLSSLLHEFLLPIEAHISRLISFFKHGKLPGLVIKHHGYRRNDREITSIAKDAGFLLLFKKDYCFLSEFKRSVLLSKILKIDGWLVRIFERWGRSIPYVRMFYFKRSSPTI